MQQRSCSQLRAGTLFRPICRGAVFLRNANVLILTDDAEFARMLSACWQSSKQAPAITILGSDLWQQHDSRSEDLVVLGPLRHAKLPQILEALEPAKAVILCAPA